MNKFNELYEATMNELTSNESMINERVEAFDVDKIMSFRKDFLVFMSNIKKGRIKDYASALQLYDAILDWRDKFEYYIFTNLKNTLKGKMMNGEIHKDDYNYWSDWLGKNVWEFVMAFRLPLDTYRVKEGIQSQESVYSDLMKYEIKKWESRVRRLSRKAWKGLEEFRFWWEDSLGKGKFGVDVSVIETEKVNGITLYINGADVKNSGISNAHEVISNTIETIKQYVSRAKSVAPILLKKKIPMFLDFDIRGMDIAGEYSKHGYRDIKEPTLALAYTAMSKNINNNVHTMAHEMGHHIYQTYMGSAERKYWKRFMDANAVELNVQKLVKEWGGNGIDEYIFDNKYLKKKDPILYLQLRGLYNTPYYKTTMENERIMTFEDLGNWAKRENIKTIRVHLKPITGYAHKNNEEAFCEALGLLVSYGASAVEEEIRYIMKKIVPTLEF
jgi:hypothetical protein